MSLEPWNRHRPSFALLPASDHCLLRALTNGQTLISSVNSPRRPQRRRYKCLSVEALQREKLRFTQEPGKKGESWLELAREVISFSVSAVSRFQAGDQRTKTSYRRNRRLEPTLVAGKLSIDAKKPFRRWAGTAKIPDMWSTVQDVRTLWQKQDPEILAVIAGLRKLSPLAENSIITRTEAA